MGVLFVQDFNMIENSLWTKTARESKAVKQ